MNGSRIGPSESRCEGLEIGVVLGDVDSSLVWADFGLPVGFAEGAIVGPPEGRYVDGSLEGAVDGLPVGTVEGVFVGESDGSVTRALAGATMNSPAGSPLTSTTEKSSIKTRLFTDVDFRSVQLINMFTRSLFAMLSSTSKVPSTS